MKRKLNENKDIVGDDGFVFLQVGINRYVATNESIAEYISKKVNSEIELYHDSGKYKSKYYFLKEIFTEDGGYVKMRVSDHEIMSRRNGVSATGGADIDWYKPIYKDNGKDVLDEYDKEELDEWIDDWILNSIEDGYYHREKRYKKGGNVTTWKDKYNKKYGYDKGTSHSLKEISKDTGVSLKGIQQIYNKGIGAYKTNPKSVRPSVKSAEQWAYGRVYSSVMGGKASKIDKNELKMEKGGKIYNAHILTDDNKMIHRRYPNKVTHNEIYNEYKDKGVEIKDSQIHFAKPIDFYDTLREETKNYVRENMNDDVDSKSIFISSMQKGNEYIATEIKGDTISGKAFTITPKDLFEITMKNNTKRDYAKGGKVKKFPISVQRRIDEINAMLPKVLDSDNYPSTYAGSTMESYVVLKKPIEIKNQYVYINADKMRDNYPFEKRYNVNDREDNYMSSNGRQALMYDLGIIKKAFTKLLKNDSSYAEGGEVDAYSTPIEQVAPNVLIATKKPKEVYLTKELKGEMYEVVTTPLNGSKSYKFKKGTKVMVIASVFQYKNKKGKNRFNKETFAKGGVVYKHKYIPTMTFEITGETENGYKGIQKDKKSLSRLERTKGKSVSYSSSEFKDLFNKETFAKGGSLVQSNIAYIDAIGSYGTNDDSWDLVTKILSKHNIKVDNSKEWHTKGYAEELYENRDGVNIFTIKVNMNDSSNPTKLKEEIANLPSRINYEFTNDYAEGGVDKDDYHYISEEDYFNVEEDFDIDTKEWDKKWTEYGEKFFDNLVKVAENDLVEYYTNNSGYDKEDINLFVLYKPNQKGGWWYNTDHFHTEYNRGNLRIVHKFGKDIVNEYQFAKGGSLESHALAIGDEILGFNMGEAYVINKGVVYMVDLAKGKRKITKMTREDAISTFEKGGMTNNFDSDFMDLVKG